MRLGYICENDYCPEPILLNALLEAQTDEQRTAERKQQGVFLSKSFEIWDYCQRDDADLARAWSGARRCDREFDGRGAAADVFFFANKIPNFLRRLFAEGAFAQAFCQF